jgi:hypothetical protein
MARPDTPSEPFGATLLVQQRGEVLGVSFGQPIQGPHPGPPSADLGVATTDKVARRDGDHPADRRHRGVAGSATRGCAGGAGGRALTVGSAVRRSRPGPHRRGLAYLTGRLLRGEVRDRLDLATAVASTPLLSHCTPFLAPGPPVRPANDRGPTLRAPERPQFVEPPDSVERAALVFPERVMDGR